jgi:hypothetical protein
MELLLRLRLPEIPRQERVIERTGLVKRMKSLQVKIDKLQPALTRGRGYGARCGGHLFDRPATIKSGV